MLVMAMEWTLFQQVDVHNSCIAIKGCITTVENRLTNNTAQYPVVLDR